MKIYFDCDGTWIDLYGVNNWLKDISNHNPRPYIEAKPLIHLPTFAKYLHKLQNKGHQIGIITWLAKDSNETYDKEVTQAKLEWFKKHLPSVNWDEIHILPYGTPKSSVGQGILFDDEIKNRQNWKGTAYDEKSIFKILKTL